VICVAAPARCKGYGRIWLGNIVPAHCGSTQPECVHAPFEAQLQLTIAAPRWSAHTSSIFHQTSPGPPLCATGKLAASLQERRVSRSQPHLHSSHTAPTHLPTQTAPRRRLPPWPTCRCASRTSRSTSASAAARQAERTRVAWLVSRYRLRARGDPPIACGNGWEYPRPADAPARRCHRRQVPCIQRPLTLPHRATGAKNAAGSAAGRPAPASAGRARARARSRPRQGTGLGPRRRG